jgi:hypothetical protein
MTVALLTALQGLVVAGLVGCVYLFVLGKRDLSVLGRRWSKRQESAQAELDGLRAELKALRERLDLTEEHAGLLVAPAPALSGLNLARRSQAIRLFRRGEPPARIAASLQIPEREIRLLLKVHRIVLNAPVGEVKAESQSVLVRRSG